MLVLHAPPEVPTSDLFHPWTVPFNPANGYHEYRFDWTPESINYYADGQFLYQFKTGIPIHPGGLKLNHWSNGDPGWSAGPPAKDAYLDFSYIKAYFNTTSSDADMKVRCHDPADPGAVCEVPDQMSPPDPSHSTVFVSPNKGLSGQSSPALPSQPPSPAPPSPPPSNAPTAPTPAGPASAKVDTLNGSCGGDAGNTCIGSAFGSCCSSYGYWYVLTLSS